MLLSSQRLRVYRVRARGVGAEGLIFKQSLEALICQSTGSRGVRSQDRFGSEDEGDAGLGFRVSGLMLQGYKVKGLGLGV